MAGGGGGGWHLWTAGGGHTKGLVKPETIGTPMLIGAFFKGSLVTSVALTCFGVQVLVGTTSDSNLHQRSNISRRNLKERAGQGWFRFVG